MIKKFIQKILGTTSTVTATVPPPPPPSTHQGERWLVSVHGINPNAIEPRAMEVVQTLQQAGYEAYLVGGAVRDLLLGLTPKDFDVATNATPETVKALFRRAFIIGRRFQLVHVVFGRGREHEKIEVSTFRAQVDTHESTKIRGNERTAKGQLAHLQHAVDASGRVLRDNVWGPIDQDAARRDFSINAMYYDPITQILVDFHQGLKDSQNKRIRIIGDPALRYREDPVRAIRALRFAAKLAHLGFTIEPKTQAAMQAAIPQLHHVPQSRLFDEMLKLLQTGHAMASLHQLQIHGLETGIYPLLDVIMERRHNPMIQAALHDTDTRVSQGKGVIPSFLLACVLWPDVLQARDDYLQNTLPHQRQPSPVEALGWAVEHVFEQRIGDVSGRGKLGADMREIWMMQPRFERRHPTSSLSLVQSIRYRAGYDFLCLRAQGGELEPDLPTWWQAFAEGDGSTRHELLIQVRPPNQRKTRTKATLPASTPTLTPPPTPLSTSGDITTSEMPRRKRRRKPRQPSASHEIPSKPSL